MKLENQVTNVYLSNKLHELGVIEPSLFFRDSTKSKEEDIEFWGKPDYCPDNVACYTTAELGKMLNKAGSDKFIKAYGEVFNFKNTTWVGILGIMNLMKDPEMGARMLIYLLENNLIILNK